MVSYEIGMSQQLFAELNGNDYSFWDLFFVVISGCLVPLIVRLSGSVERSVMHQVLTIPCLFVLGDIPDHDHRARRV